MIENYYKPFLLLLLVLVLPLALAVGQGSISVESKVDHAKIFIGDRILYSVLVTRTPDVKVQMPSLAANLGMFEISDYEVHDPIESDGKIIAQTDYVISTFETGEFEIPPLTIRYTVASDTTLKELNTEPIKIVVESLNPDQAGDIRDIKPPLEIPRNWAILIRFIVAGALGAAIIALIVLIIIRRKQGKSLIPRRIKPPRPPHEVALEELDALTSSDLLEKGEVKSFYSTLSEIIRRYIEGRFFIVAMEMTTYQLMENMRQAAIETEHCDLVQELLRLSDIVKFAKYLPAAEETEEAVSLAYDFIHRTKLVIEEIAPQEDASKKTESEMEPVLAGDSEVEEEGSTQDLEPQEGRGLEKC